MDNVKHTMNYELIDWDNRFKGCTICVCKTYDDCLKALDTMESKPDSFGIDLVVRENIGTLLFRQSLFEIKSVQKNAPIGFYYTDRYGHYGPCVYSYVSKHLPNAGYEHYSRPLNLIPYR